MKKERIAIAILLTMTLSIPFIFNAPNHNIANNNETESETYEETEINENDEIYAMTMEMKSLEEIKDRKEWFIKYKEIINKYSNLLNQQVTIYDLHSQEEVDLLFRVVQAEIGGEQYTFEQKCNVASVILNRVNHERFPNNLKDNLIPSQFCTIRNGSYKKVEVSEETILACEYVSMFGDTTNGCLFFDNNNVLNYEFVFNDSVHNFYRL